MKVKKKKIIQTFSIAQTALKLGKSCKYEIFGELIYKISDSFVKDTFNHNSMCSISANQNKFVVERLLPIGCK